MKQIQNIILETLLLLAVSSHLTFSQIEERRRFTVSIATKLGVERIIEDPKMSECGSDLFNHLAYHRDGSLIAHLVLEKKKGLYLVIPLQMVSHIDFSNKRPVVKLRSGVEYFDRLVNCAISESDESIYNLKSLTKLEVIEPAEYYYETDSSDVCQVKIASGSNYDTTFLGVDPRLLVYSSAGYFWGAGIQETRSFWIKQANEELEANLADFSEVALSKATGSPNNVRTISVTNVSGSTTTRGVFVMKGKDTRGTHDGDYLGLVIALQGQSKIRILVGPEWRWKLLRNPKK